MIFLEEILNENEITENLKYFVNYWDFFCNSIENPSVYTTVMTPHYLVREIIDELETNGTDNYSNFRFFQEQNEKFLNNTILFDKDLKSLWILLHEKLMEKDKQIFIIKSLVEKLNEHFNSVIYKKDLFTKLEKLINDKDANFDLIKLLTEEIIFQFIFEDYSIKTIKEIVKKVYSNYEIVDYGDGRRIFNTSYPLKTKNNDDDEEFIKLATQEMDNLTFSNRFWEIYNFLLREKQNYYFIFYLKGIFFDKELTFNDVTFYNPKKKPMINTSVEMENDIFHNANYEIGMNVIVLQDGRDILKAKQAAIDKIGIVCDFFKLFDDSKANFYLDDSDYRVLNNEKKLSTWSMGRSKEQIGPYDVIREQETLDYVTECFISLCNNQYISEYDKNKILDSIHFYRKAKESDSQEEQLLNYWIALERLFLDYDNISNKFERTCIFTKSFLIERYIFQNGWNCYNLVNRLLTTKTIHNGQFRPEIIIPKELQIKANIGEFLTYPITIELEKFINCIPEIQMHCSNIHANNTMQNVRYKPKQKKLEMNY